MSMKSAVFHKNSYVGEVDIYHKNNSNSNMGAAWAREIRISHFSPPSDRCPPLAVLHSVAPGGAVLKMESLLPELHEDVYLPCLRENKTAVVASEKGELHLVAMSSRRNLMQYSTFWGFLVAPGLYNSCLLMLNIRCLGIVFDLDETLIVANTMRSFEDRINILLAKLSTETDPQRATGMLAEVKRYQDDKSILKQYSDNDQVVDNGKVFIAQSEVVQPMSDSQQPFTRPIIRIQEKNIILTRVNPAVRDTSVLVRLRPAWEDLRSYLIARGRKRFEVYVCTMAEREYALEMWRLLDPEANLINSKELLNRIMCVKPGTKKSLLNLFQGGNCHPKMALVIDDRLGVWEEKDQPRVHVVPAFAPYYAPQAEANSTIPVLCVARNVACNVRGSFFKEFDEGLLSQITNFCYEDEMVYFPSTPDVGNYLISEDATPASNGNKDPLGFEGMSDVEVERRLKEPNCSVQAIPPRINNFDPRPMSFQHVLSAPVEVPLAASQVMMPNHPYSQSTITGNTLRPPGAEPSLQCSTTEEGEVPESDLDPNTRRRLLILQHGQDIREPPPPPPFPFRQPQPVTVPPQMQLPGHWVPPEEDIKPRQLNNAPKEFRIEQEGCFDRNRSHRPSFFHGGESTLPSDRVLHENQRLPAEVNQRLPVEVYGDVRVRASRPVSNYNAFSGEDMPIRRNSSNYGDVHFDSGRTTAQYDENPAVVLQDIVMKSGGGKVEFRTGICDTGELQFSVEAWLVGEIIGEGIGRTRKEARHQAVMSALRSLANKYMTNRLYDPISVHGDVNKPRVKENGLVSDSYGCPAFSRGDRVSISDSRPFSHNLEGQRSSIIALKELCTVEGYSLSFQAQPSSPGGSVRQGGDLSAQVEIQGQILGKGIGKTWEEAKLQAADEAHDSLKSMLGQFVQKRSCSPRLQLTNKRSKQDFSRGLQRFPSGRYTNSGTSVP